MSCSLLCCRVVRSGAAMAALVKSLGLDRILTPFQANLICF